MFPRVAGMEMYEPGLAAQTSLEATWTRFEQVSARLTRFLGTSEAEFAHLIGALDDCWSMAESVQKANAHLSGLSSVESDPESLAIRSSMLDGCTIFRKFLDQIQAIGHELEAVSLETKGVLRTSNLLLEDLVPLTHIAFHLRLESCRLSPEYASSVMKGYEEMVEVLSARKENPRRTPPPTSSRGSPMPKGQSIEPSPRMQMRQPLPKRGFTTIWNFSYRRMSRNHAVKPVRCTP